MATSIPTMQAFALLGLLAVISCSDHAAKRPSSRDLRQADSAIYAVVLDSLRPGGRPARVERQYLPLPGSRAEIAYVGGWAAAQREHLDSVLIVALIRDRHAGSVAAAVGDRPGLRWIDRDSVTTEISRHDETMMVVQLSRVVYSSDFSRAVVYASMWCGRLCGNGTFYQLQRSPGGAWHLTGKAVYFVS